MADKHEIVSSSEDEEGSNSSYMVYCNLCKTGFSSTVPYRQHLKGSQHKKNETKKFMKEKYGVKYLEAMEKLKNGEATTSAVPEAPAADDDETLILTCTVCKKVCTGYLPYKLHMASRSHTKQVQKEQLIAKLRNEGGVVTDSTKESTNPLYETMPQLKPFAYCDLCKKSFNGPENYKKHFDSEIHKKEMVKRKIKDDLQKNGLQNGKFHDDSEDGTFLVTCETCKKSFSSVIPYQQHLISEAHKNKEKDNALVEKVGHLAINDEDGSIQCAECGKMFSGPKPLYQHIQGPAHAKQKKRDQILEELHSKFPEFMTESAKADGDDDSDGEMDFLLCTICHKSFSGPESAQDHFRSKKHLKAKKEKMRIVKLKQEKKIKLKDIGNLPNDAPSSSSVVRNPEHTGNLKDARKHLDSSEEFEMI